MSYLHLASTANSSSSSTPSSYLHVNSNGGVSTVPSSIGSNSPSIFGSVGGGKQWTTIGQPTSSSSSSTLTQQLLMKQQQQHLLNNQQTNSSSSSSHFDSILGLTMASALASSSQTQIEKNFELQQEDFPPLPHRSNSHEPTSSSSTSNAPPLYQTQYSLSSSSSNHQQQQQPITNGYTSSQQQHSQSQSPISFKTSIDALSNLINRHQVSTTNKTSSTNNPQQISNTSTIPNTNGLPSSTITDQYGLVGLLQMIQQAEKNPDTSTLLNYDLTTLGLSMESQNDLYPSFLSPFSDSQARPYEIDYQVPFEYQMGMQIREKLPPLNFNTLNEDTLFFLFYLFGNDHVQLLSAAELYRRDWRYHKDERLWLTRIKNIMPDHKYETYETGVYCVFDVQLWRKTHKSMRIDYDKLDGKKKSFSHLFFGLFLFKLTLY
jgi:CCR4-NOT transcription complex subunit 2